ncbi:site-specific integrase [Mycobacterium sp. SMC-8]|uniref:tyrosine-type recombinase/integrase n=1 Tax=Mycobacterium sp. SMC-8 TaxID=2857060 RepID=UPI0021B20999|nr:site-specific integrase [Mycobacterium sp. SMC-8]UXA12388.1 site-specific integrase [Mycobacterium sp. SMC-8]
MSDARTPGTGGVVDLWKNRDGSPSKLATKGWAEGKGRPQGVGSRWRGWYVGDDGKMRTQRFRTEVDAEAWVADAKSKIHTRTWINPSAARETFGAVAEQWIDTKGHRKPKTLAGYRSLLDTIVLPKWKDVALSEITYPAYVAWLSGLSVNGSQDGKPLSASRITQAHQLVGAVLKYAQKSGKVVKNVATEISRTNDLPEPTEAERRYLTHAELARLAGHCGRFQTLTLVLGYCGLRFGEAVALRRKHVGDRVLTIRSSATHVTGKGIVETSTKTGKVREVPVPEPVWERLQAELPDDPDALVFSSRKGGYLPLGEYRWVFDKACTEAGIDGLVPHGLRHTTASLAISAGANVKAVQRLLGHASATMTLDRYAKLFDDDLAGVAKALGDAARAAAAAA